MARMYFHAYHSYLKSMEPLNDAERGRLFTALLIYSETGAEPELRGNERFLFPTMREQIDRDAVKYEAKCDTQSRNARKRWDATACDGMPTDANVSQTCQGKEKEEGKEERKGKGKGIKVKDTARERAPDVFAAYAGDNAELTRALQDFAAMRKGIKKPMTDRARQLLVSKLQKLSTDADTQVAILDQSTLHCWQDVYEIKTDERPPMGGNYIPRETDLARRKRLLDEQIQRDMEARHGNSGGHAAAWPYDPGNIPGE